jgi:hypothetical protein
VGVGIYLKSLEVEELSPASDTGANQLVKQNSTACNREPNEMFHVSPLGLIFYKTSNKEALSLTNVTDTPILFRVQTTCTIRITYVTFDNFGNNP